MKFCLQAENLTELQNLLISRGNNTALILYELGHACAQLVRTEMFDVIVHKDKDTYLINRIENYVQLKKIIKQQRIPIYTKKVEGDSGILFGLLLESELNLIVMASL